MAVDLQARYSRQELFAPVGPEGQRRIEAGRVLVAGCGGLGTVSASLLARAGVGFLRIVDRDLVERSNLQRQALFEEDDALVARPKAVAAARRLAGVNSGVRVEPVVEDVHAGNVRRLLEGVDLVVDGFDNLQGRYLLNEACVEAGVPWVYGACVEARGVAGLIVPGQTPCLRCLYPDVPEPGVAPTCDSVGVLGSATHATAALQVAMTLRLLVTRQAPRPFALLALDVWEGRSERVEVEVEPGLCPTCAGRRFELLDSPPREGAPCGRSAVLVRAGSPLRPDLAALALRLAGSGRVVVNEHLLRLDAGGLEVTLWADGRLVVKGTDSPEVARDAAALVLRPGPA